MSAQKLAQLGVLVAVSVGSGTLLSATPSRADDYSDLLDILRAKGSLTQGEYATLLSKHVHRAQALSDDTSTARSSRAGLKRGKKGGVNRADFGTDTSNPDVLEARAAAASAAQSAQDARLALASTQSAVNSPSIVRVANYVPGKGITLKAGPVDINVSGFVNGFYTYNSPNGGAAVAGGLSTGSSKFDSSSIRNGLLPAGLIVKLMTHQAGLDLAAVFGVYPGTNSSTNGSLNANSGGSPIGLGTAGIDFRQIYMTAGNANIGTFKIGRDLGIFGGEAILNDATLASVGTTGGNSAPGNTSLGRIGVGYVYADWIPQISYQSPVLAGFQGTVGVLTPLDSYNYAGDNAAGQSYSATSEQHSSPMGQAKITYDFKAGDLTGHIWTGFLVQHQGHLQNLDFASSTSRSATSTAEEVGTKMSYKGLQVVGYYYHGAGLGTTGLFFDGISANGRKRMSEGYYAQVAYNPTKKLKLVGSYGVSNLYQAPGENNPSLVRRNESEIGAVYYSLTDWLTLVGEYGHTRAAAHGPYANGDNSISAGAILFF